MANKKINQLQLKQLVEAAIFTAGQPLSIEKIKADLLADVAVTSKQLKAVIDDIGLDYADRGVNLVNVASGYRFQAALHLGPMLSQMWQDKPAKYSRALLETLALIAYKQPITRGEIEDVRGVAVSSNIIRTLIERNWVKEVGHKEVPGRPALLGTTSEFLDYFSLQSLSELPQLIEPESLELIEQKLAREFMGVDMTTEQGLQASEIE